MLAYSVYTLFIVFLILFDGVDCYISANLEAELILERSRLMEDSID